MLRSLGKRDDGYELFEIASPDDLDFATFLPMVDGAWAADYVDQSRLDYDEAVFRKLMRGSWWVAVLACDSEGAPVGFELALERTLRVGEQVLHAYYASAFTVSAEHRRKGLGSWILEGINQLVFEKNKADLIVSTFHLGHAGSPTVQSTFDRIDDWGVVRFHSTPIWSRRLDKEPLPPLDPSPSFVRLAMVGDVPADGIVAIGDASASAADSKSVPDAETLDQLIRAEFATSFALDASLSGQYLDPSSDSSGTFLYDFGPGSPILALWNILPMAINERRLRPIVQLQFLLAPESTDAQIETVVHHLGLHFAEQGCFAITVLDMGMVPRSVLENLGFSATDDGVAFAVRGPGRAIEPFERARPPLFLDFT